MKVSELFKDKKDVVVFGVAGARKTSLGVKVAKEHLGARILYLSFGRENTASASKRFPSKNTDCYNFHTLAKRLLSIHSSRIIDRVDMSLVSATLKSNGIECRELHLIESTVILLEHFVTCGLPLTQLRRLMMHADFAHLKKQDKELVCYFFTQFWLISFRSEGYVSHDMYFKEATLTPTILPYDILIVDECQDLNDAMYQWIDNMRAANYGLKILKMGDPAQQIFSFMGASERFLFEKPDVVLGKTYRFGSKIAGFVNDFMENHPLPYYSGIMSDSALNGKLISYHNDGDAVQMIPELPGKVAVVSQYNLTLLQWMIRLTKSGYKYHVLGNIHAKEKSQIQALFQLYHTGRCNYSPWKNKDYAWIKEEAKHSGDKAMLVACRFIETLKRDDNIILEQVLRGRLSSADQADVILTTIHQAKGLEFDAVIVANDLPGESSISNISRPQTHCVYTTLTRAKTHLVYPAAYFNK